MVSSKDDCWPKNHGAKPAKWKFQDRSDKVAFDILTYLRWASLKGHRQGKFTTGPSSALLERSRMSYPDKCPGKVHPKGFHLEQHACGILFWVSHKHSFITVLSDTMAANCTDRENSVVTIRQTCVAWFQNARDRRGGRSRWRYTCPKMPLVSMRSVKFIYWLSAGTKGRKHFFGGANSKNVKKCVSILFTQ